MTTFLHDDYHRERIDVESIEAGLDAIEDGKLDLTCDPDDLHHHSIRFTGKDAEFKFYVVYSSTAIAYETNIAHTRDEVLKILNECKLPTPSPETESPSA
jgi:hypothetical protein